MREQFAGRHVDVEKAIAFWVLRAQAAVRTEMYRAFSVLGVEMTPEQWVVLARLWNQDRLTQTELGALTHKDKPTMSRILALMEKRGWLKRVASPADSRQHVVMLTAVGKGLEQRAMPVAQRMVRKLEKGFSQGELVTLRSHLQRIVRNLDGDGE
jgi:DNA-binding MarR family transcriptional regulator